VQLDAELLRHPQRVIALGPGAVLLADGVGVSLHAKAGEKVDALSQLVHRTKARERALHACEKLKEEIEDTHELFKAFIVENRPGVDIARVSTGEHWYGTRALELKLIDKLMTSDDYLLAASKEADLYEISYTAKKSVSERIAAAMQAGVERLIWSFRNTFLHG